MTRVQHHAGRRWHLFIIVSLLMAHANFVKREQTGTHAILAVAVMSFLAVGLLAILRYQWLFHVRALGVTLGIYAVLGIGSAIYARRRLAYDLIENRAIREHCSRSRGLFLVTGPTSGGQ